MCFHTTKEDLERYAEAHPLEVAALAATSPSKLAQHILNSEWYSTTMQFERNHRMRKVYILDAVNMAVRTEAKSIGMSPFYAERKSHEEKFWAELEELRELDPEESLSDYQLITLMAHDTPTPRFAPEPAKEPALV